MGLDTAPDQVSTDHGPGMAFDRTIDWVIGAVLGIVVVMTLVYFVGLGALGGYIGAKVQNG